MQHLTPDAYRAHKQSLIESAFRHYGLDSGILSPLLTLPVAARRRVEWKTRYYKGKVELGYHAQESHDLVDISNCPVLKSELQALIPKLKEAITILPVSARPIAIKALAAEQGIDLTLEFAQAPAMAAREALVAFAQRLNVIRLSVKITNDTEAIYTACQPTVLLGDVSIGVPPDIFLQATDEAQDAIIALMRSHLKKCRKILDLFSGIGTYSFGLAKTAHLTAIEGNQAMVEAATLAARKAALGPRVTTECRDLFRNPLVPEELKKYDGVVINPPRAGAEKQCTNLAKSSVGKITMVSCNPSTAARDVAILQKGGYRLASAVGIDQFAYSNHVEMVMHLVKDTAAR